MDVELAEALTSTFTTVRMDYGLLGALCDVAENPGYPEEEQQPLINEALCGHQWASGKRWSPRAANAAAATSL